MRVENGRFYETYIDLNFYGKIIAKEEKPCIVFAVYHY